MALSGIRERARQARVLLRNEGAGKFARRVAQTLVARVYDSGTVVWIHRDANPQATADGAAEMVVTLVEPGTHAEQVADSMRPITTSVRAARQAAGGKRYIVHAGNIDDPIYTLWTYTERLPVAEHLGVSVPMPEGAVAVEDSYIAPAHRGIHAAVAAIDALGAHLHAEGLRKMLGKIDEENKAALGAARVSGWLPFGRVHGTVWLNRIPRWKVQLDEPVVPQLELLERNPRGA